jgi:hypothetical protein
MHFLECFQKFIDEDMWQLFAEQTNIYATQFLAATHCLKPRSRARSWMDTNPTEMKTLTGLLRDIKEEAYQEMCHLLGQWKEEIVIILVS